MLARFLRFNAVGALGIVVQVAAVGLLVSVLHVHYLAATALAIELAILHNFAWHERWTWGDRAKARADRPEAYPTSRVKVRQSAYSRRSVFFRCLAFHAGNGCVSLLGSLVLMPLLVGTWRLHYLLSNLVAIGATGVLNFVVSDRVVFAQARGRGRVRGPGPLFVANQPRASTRRGRPACRPTDV